MRWRTEIVASTKSPCAESWQQMKGDGRQRFCGHCQKHVHDFASLHLSEIEDLLKGGSETICARLTHRGDGSLVTLDSLKQPAAFAPAALLCAALMLSAPALAQQHHATISGQVLNPSGEPIPAARVELAVPGATLETKTDADGRFSFEANPGVVDIHIRSGLFAANIRNVNVHEGEQMFSPIRTKIDVDGLDGLDRTVLVGEVKMTVHYPWYRRPGVLIKQLFARLGE